MAITDVLAASDICTAINACKANDYFSPKNFFAIVGLSKKSPFEIKSLLLQIFSKGACALTAAETKAFLMVGDIDGDVIGSNSGNTHKNRRTFYFNCRKEVYSNGRIDKEVVDQLHACFEY
ncbi:parvalbumin, thymic-like [Misgurnus anguillicaudatus]|uniref:parvalbumin, thymic-like n=1 Tax=Misgurnus anguillicaudatus TaxID=75329 RepID=UPI003CCF7AAD